MKQNRACDHVRACNFARQAGRTPQQLVPPPTPDAKASSSICARCKRAPGDSQPNTPDPRSVLPRCTSSVCQGPHNPRKKTNTPELRTAQVYLKHVLAPGEGKEGKQAEAAPGMLPGEGGGRGHAAVPITLMQAFRCGAAGSLFLGGREVVVLQGRKGRDQKDVSCARALAPGLLR